MFATMLTCENKEVEREIRGSEPRASTLSRSPPCVGVSGCLCVRVTACLCRLVCMCGRSLAMDCWSLHARVRACVKVELNVQTPMMSCGNKQEYSFSLKTDHSQTNPL